MPRKRQQEPTTKGVELAPVDDYEERPMETADTEEADIELRAVEMVGRPEQDQIPDYHQENPTMDKSGPEHDMDVHRELSRQVWEKESRTARKQAREAAAEESE